jgi:hypothetical protein
MTDSVASRRSKRERVQVQSGWWLWLLTVAPLACAPPAPGPLPLEPEDFVLRGVPFDADSGEIRLSLGEPDSVVQADNPYEAATPTESWHYEGLIIRYSESAVPTGFVITGGEEETLRGVRVGDPADRVLHLYGRPVYEYDGIWTYIDPLDVEGRYVVEFLIEDDVVRRIHLGRNWNQS